MVAKTEDRIANCPVDGRGEGGSAEFNGVRGLLIVEWEKGGRRDF